MSPLRILAFDHFFDQDLDALGDALKPGDSLDVVSYRRLHRLARRVFPDDAFTGVRRAYEDDMDSAWQRYEAIAGEFASWMAAAYRPQVFVVPSDVFFYLRPVITRVRDLGVPTVVVQKETTISPMVMGRHADEVGAVVPFMSDLMTVCSERHREFWLRCGADPEKVVVTGQPRFDVYRWDQRPERPGRPRLLYLSFDDVAYLPADLGDSDGASWRDLRRSTEEAIGAAAQRWDVRAKLHPQQSVGDDWLGDLVTRVDRRADTRRLIVDADVVLGFQTTGLFEAALAGKPIIYPAWGPTFERLRETLIPFDGYEGLVNHARTPEELVLMLASGLDESVTVSPSDVAREAVAEHLGPTDGKASERVITLLRASAGEPRVHRIRRMSIAWAILKGGVGAAVLAMAAGVAAVGRGSLRCGLDRRAREYRQLRDEGLILSRIRSP